MLCKLEMLEETKKLVVFTFEIKDLSEISDVSRVNTFGVA